MKRKRTLSIFAILMTAVLAFSGIRSAGPILAGRSGYTSRNLTGVGLIQG
ncbi:hypothetical protein M1N50_03600 [Dehalococcoidia bacterium]|nr:hypothetical protein [Dehalococcoidia bacterium]MCL0069690.1 hypothetical protein [Dehalococcoidia bacterium]MCL0079237.1 hypothetical protein [Dehalococcoidia bacterium]MCL0088828.1 hypothetical protein [Dehalococcoidia bacterium]